MRPDRRATKAARAAKLARVNEAARTAAAQARDAAASAKARGEARQAQLASRQQRLVARREGRTRQVEARKAALAEQVKRRRPARARRPRRWLIPVLLGVIALLLLRCPEDPEPEPSLAGSSGPRAPGPTPVVPEPDPAPSSPPSRVARSDRPELAAKPAEVPAWLVGFRMQVSARSPRLARCFEGIERPGRIKWTASVEPSSGQVGDHLIESQLLTGELSSREADCVEEVLSTPDYRIPETEETGPRRVSVVLEF